MNEKHLRRLVDAMYEIDDFPALDEYCSKIFGYPVRKTWRLLRYVTRNAKADIWGWSPVLEVARYPGSIKVPTFEEFATMIVHEATHGLCHFLKEDPFSRNYKTGIDEEQVCWHVSKLVCKMLGISYHKKLAKLNYKFWLIQKTRDKELSLLMKKLPPHNR